MTMDQLINVLVTGALVAMMVALGLGVSFAELAAVVRDGRLVLAAVVANYVLVPAVTLGLLLVFRAEPMVAAGFLILGVCPGAPFGPPVVALAKGHVPAAVGLMVILAASSAVLAPLLLHYLLPLAAGSEALSVDATRVVVTLLVTQLIPLAVGLSVRQWRPGWADRLRGPARAVGAALTVAVVGIILFVHAPTLTTIRPFAYLGMFLLLVASWAAGWFLGGRDAGVRRALTLTTSLRNVGVGLVIATGAFAGTPAVTATLVFGLFGVFGTVLLALAWARRTPGVAPGPTGPAGPDQPCPDQA